ncbi:MAG TPA: hypothetical protein PKM63_02075 [Panacibacter sp.]|nr:hypothetical protein [Panacibacter sp.]HNP43044.1 hypothetical protein [Panacibacter sp.]
MILLDAVAAVYHFYILLFTLTLVSLFAGIVMYFKALKAKDEYEMRKAKFIMMFAVIAMLCIALVSFFEIGRLPVD